CHIFAPTPHLNPLSLHDALPIFIEIAQSNLKIIKDGLLQRLQKWKTIRLEYARITSQWFNKYLSQKGHTGSLNFDHDSETLDLSDRKSTRLNSSHVKISYAVFCL